MAPNKMLHKMNEEFIEMMHRHQERNFVHKTLTFEEYILIAYKDQSFKREFEGKEFEQKYLKRSPVVPLGRLLADVQHPRDTVAALIVNLDSDKIILLHDVRGWKFPMFTLTGGDLNDPLSVLKSKLCNMTGVGMEWMAERFSPENFIELRVRVDDVRKDVQFYIAAAVDWFPTGGSQVSIDVAGRKGFMNDEHKSSFDKLKGELYPLLQDGYPIV